MTLDLLEQRLADLDVATPDAGRITARVLSNSRLPLRRPFARAAALVVATIVIAVGVLYFVPAADAALADAPIAGGLLRDAGLAGARDRVTAVGVVSTSSGYRLELVAAYADSTRTVLLLHAEPAIWLTPLDPELKDQFGRTYRMQSALGNALTGNLVLEFEPMAWPDSITGARLTLHMTSVAPVTCVAASSGNPNDSICTNQAPVRGSWTLPATVGVDEGTAVALPASARLGPATYRFTSVRSTAATIAIDIEITGLTSADLDRRIPDGGKGAAVFDIELLAPSGEMVNDTYWSSDDAQGVELHVLGHRLTPGDYHVHVSYIGFGEFDRVVHIP